MNDLGTGAILLFTPAVVILALALRRRNAERAARRTGAGALLDRADLFSLQGAWKECAEIAEAVVRESERGRGGEPAVLHARACLLMTECEAGLDRRQSALSWLTRASAARARLADGDDARALMEAERLAQAGFGRAGGDVANDWPAADALLSEAAAAPATASDPRRLIRLARLAVGRAEDAMREGSWPRARAHLEQAVVFGERAPVEVRSALFGQAREHEHLLAALARSRASSAAAEIGQVLASLGREDEARTWLDRSVSSLEGAILPPAIIARSRALIVRAMFEPADAVRGSEPRARLLQRARDVAATCDWPAAQGLLARAEIQLGVLRVQEGRPHQAQHHFRAAHECMVMVASAGAAELIAESRLLLGHVLEDSGDLDEARAEYRRALDAGREDPDPDARRLAAVAGCHLHRLLHHADRADEARVLLEPLEALAPTLHPSSRPLVAAMVARCRGQQSFRDGDRSAADETLRRAMKLVEGAEGPEAADLARQISFERGNLAFDADPAEAEVHLRHALATPSGSRPPAVEEAERAEIRLRLAHALLQLERGAEAVAELRRAFERGRDSGRANGRAIAAAAALMLGDNPESTLVERRGWYESAGRFGRLSGTERGRQVAEVIEQRLRELTE